MDATPYIERIRRITGDYEDEYRKGLFWADHFLLLALNAAQDAVFSKALDLPVGYPLRRLVTPLVSPGGPLPLPADYAHFVTGVITRDSGERRFARVYLGAEAVTFFHSLHDAVFIVGDTAYFQDMGNLDGTGVLHYYRRPSPLLRPGDPGFTAAQEFDAAIYDIILNLAIKIISIKETLTRRAAAKGRRAAAAWAAETPGDFIIPSTERRPDV